jgi:site-specific DNA-methyltransferase (adenine-specific)
VKGQEIVFSHKSDEWETPQDIFDELNEEFEFTLDPCATLENAKCDLYIDREHNGLEADWSGHNVFVNPPYSEIAKWVEKAHKECGNWDVERDCLVVMLLPARTDTRWFHEYIYKKPNVEIRFIKGRLKFGDSKNSAPFPSMVIIFR